MNLNLTETPAAIHIMPAAILSDSLDTWQVQLCSTDSQIKKGGQTIVLPASVRQTLTNMRETKICRHRDEGL